MIHFIWIDNPMPKWVQINIREFALLNSEMEINVWDEGALLDKYKDIYCKLEDTAQRSDLLRYSVLQKYGGWYFDTDFFPLRPIHEIEKEYGIQDDTFFLTEQKGNNPRLPIANGVIYSNGKNWEKIDEEIFKIDPKKNRAVYGPMMFTKLYRESPEMFVLGKPEMFYPFDREKAQKMYPSLRKCNLKNNPFVVHLWASGKDVLWQI